jgi:cholesterol transport system auxiliary component
MRALLILLAGCALTSKAPPRELRYFAPASRVGPTATAAPSEPRATLRLGHIVAGAVLGTRILHRESAVEVAPYETLRWTERPDTYVRRALVHALFDVAPLDQAPSGAAPTLDVDVLAFEEVRGGGRHVGRVELRYRVQDGQRVITHGTIATERAAGETIEDVVTAIGDALDAAAAQIAVRVTAKLSAR